MPPSSPASPAPPVLELRDVQLREARPNVSASPPLNWQVGAGDYWVVGGPPSSGKSDFLALAAGLQIPVQGEHFLFGKNTGAMTEAELLGMRRKVGLVFAEGGRLFNHLTVAENVALPLCYHENRPLPELWEPVCALLEFMGLAAVAHNTPGILARPWRQRAGLARALALQPELLLLDDPLAGSDFRETEWWLERLSSLVAGNAVTGNKKVAVVVGVGDLRPWLGPGRQFGLLQSSTWTALGGSAEVAQSTNPWVRELLRLETPS